MTTQQKGIITLLKSAVTCQSLPLPADFTAEQLSEPVKRHHMATLIYDGAVRCGMDRGEPVMQQLFRQYCRGLLKSEKQMAQLQRVFGAFEAGGIDYMPLKGCRMKALYPKPELRVMGDADVLIRLEQRERIREIMEVLGFQNPSESDHEIVWKNEGLYLELHKRLIPSYNKDFFAWYGDGWQLAEEKTGCRYEMTPENAWIFQFTHFAKHYRDGGIGCRHVVDLWVYRRANAGMEEAYIRSRLEQLQLLAFYENILRLLDVWFADGEADEKTDFITDFIFASGSWGDMSTRVLSVGVRDGGQDRSTAKSRLGWVRAVVFPGVQTLKGKYTVLQKAPWLLPGVWAVRPFYKLLREREDVEKRSDQLRSLTREKLDARQQALRYVGLDYNF